MGSPTGRQPPRGEPFRSFLYVKKRADRVGWRPVHTTTGNSRSRNLEATSSWTPRHRSTMEQLTPRLGEPDPARRKEQRSGGLAPSHAAVRIRPRFAETKHLPLAGGRKPRDKGE